MRRRTPAQEAAARMARPSLAIAALACIAAFAAAAHRGAAVDAPATAGAEPLPISLVVAAVALVVAVLCGLAVCAWR